MFVTVKGYCKGFDFFPTCMLIGNVIFDQLGIGDFVHGALSGIHALGLRKYIARQIINRLQKFLDGLFMERQVVLNGVPNIGKVDADISRNDPFGNADHV